MRILMTGGGTAGHVNPAIAIANTIKEKHPDCEIAFVCSSQKGDKAADLVPRAGYDKLYKVNICGSYSIYNPKNIKTLCLMAVSSVQAKKIIKGFMPDIIIGTGGFACYPVLNEGAKLGIPTVVHESNAIPGRAVRKLAPRVDLVMTNFESSASMLGGARRVMRVGNPIIRRPETSGGSMGSDGFEESVLSFGGSLGAENLNLAVLDVLRSLADKYPKVLFYHASGKRDYENMKAKFSEAGLDKKKNVVLVDYIYDMADRMQSASVVISRAGAMTISELALYGKASILVPSPYVAANHQYKNARTLADAGAAMLVEESELRSGRLKDKVVELLEYRETRESISRAVVSFANHDANEVIYREIMSLIKK